MNSIHAIKLLLIVGKKNTITIKAKLISEIQFPKAYVRLGFTVLMKKIMFTTISAYKFSCAALKHNVHFALRGFVVLCCCLIMQYPY